MEKKISKASVKNVRKKKKKDLILKNKEGSLPKSTQILLVIAASVSQVLCSTLCLFPLQESFLSTKLPLK